MLLCIINFLVVVAESEYALYFEDNQYALYFGVIILIVVGEIENP